MQHSEMKQVYGRYHTEEITVCKKERNNTTQKRNIIKVTVPLLVTFIIDYRILEGSEEDLWVFE